MTGQLARCVTRTTPYFVLAMLLASAAGPLRPARAAPRQAAPVFPTFSYPSDANHLGNVTSYVQSGNTITITTGTDQVKVIVCEQDLIRIEYGRDGVFTDESASYAVVKYAWANPLPTVEDRTADLVIATDELYVRVIKTPLRFEFYDKAATLLSRDKYGVASVRTTGHVGLSRTLSADEHVYGFGERCATSLDCRGLQIENWTRDSYNDKNGMKYKAFTLYHSTRGYGLFVDNHAHALIDVGKQATDELVYDFDGGKLDYYFVKGNARQVLDRYTDLTGRPALFPKWAMGYQQAKYAYQTRDELLTTADTFRSKNIPCDVMWLDGPNRGWWANNVNVDPAFDNRYPNPADMSAYLASKGFKLGLLINHTMDTVAPRYSEGIASDYYVKNQNGSVFVSSQWNGSCATVDFTKPGAGAWFGSLLTPLVDLGVDAWWVDMDDGGYPELRDGYSNRVFAGGPGWKIHNINGGLLDADALQSSLKQQKPAQRPFVMVRGGASGMQRSAWTWSADLRFESWEDLKRQMRMEQNMSMVGVVYSSDIGGCTCPLQNNGESYLRWMQAEIFNFFTRTHFDGSSCADKHPWTYGATIESAARNWIGWKYRMLPYIYTEYYNYTQTGAPLQRPLVFEYPGDPNVYNKSDEMMFGDWLLVAPVVDGSNTTGASNVSRSVYLPAGTWIDYRDGQTVYTGPTTIANYAADLNTVPIFVKAGAIVPMQPLMQYVGQLPVNLITLDLYPSGSTSYTLYEDDGTSLEYVNGAWTKTKVDVSASGNSVTVVINDRQSGGGAYTPDARDYLLKLHNRDDGANTVRVNGLDLPFKSLDELNAGQTGWYHDLTNDLIWVRVGDTGGTLSIEVLDGGTLPAPVLTTISVTPSTASVVIGSSVHFNAVGTDQYGVPLATQPAFTWSVTGGGLIDAGGTFIAGSIPGGPFVLTASSGDKTGAANVTVTGGSTIVDFESRGGANQTLTGVYGGIDWGSSSASWHTDSGAGKTVEAWISASSTSATSRTITLPAGRVLRSLKSWASPPATLQVGSTGNTTRTFTLSSTKIEYSTGWTTASPSVVLTVTDSHGASDVNIDDLVYDILAPNSAPTVAVAPSATPNPVTAMTTNLAVLGADDGGEGNLTYTWAAVGTPPGPVSVAPNGTNAAKATTATFSTAGTYSLQVTIEDQGNLTVTSSVSVIVNPPAPDFALSATPTTRTVTAGSSTSFVVTVSPTGSFTGDVALSASGLPPGASFAFAPTVVTGGAGSSTMTVTADATMSASTSSVTITGTSATLMHGTGVTLMVQRPDFAIAATPSSRTVTAGSSTTYSVTITPAGGFTGDVTLTAGGLPVGATGAFVPPVIPGGTGTSALTVTTDAAMTASTATVTIAGTSAALAHSTPVTLAVQRPVTSGTGLSGAYFNDTGTGTFLSGAPVLTRVDPTVNFTWTGAPATGVPADHFSVRWTGQVLAPVTGNYVFTTVSDDGVRLWVNGQQIINNWTDHGATSNSGGISLTAGIQYDIRMEFYENTQNAVAQLSWSYPGRSQVIIPQTALYATPDFSVGATPFSQTVPPGASAVYSVAVGAVSGFSGSVALSVAGLPAGASATFVPSALPAGSGTSVLTVTAGATLGMSSLTITGTSGAVSHGTTVTMVVGNGSLSGLLATPSGTQSVSALGTTDWTHWGLSSAGSFNHKAGVTSQISTFSSVAGRTASRYTNNPIGFSWTGGTPTSSATNTTTGVYMTGLNQGFRMTAPADTTLRTLTVYVGVRSAQGKFVAHLSDGSAADFVDTGLNSASGISVGTYTLTYRAASAGQTLTVTFTQNNANSSQARVMLQATTLK